MDKMRKLSEERTEEVREIVRLEVSDVIKAGMNIGASTTCMIEAAATAAATAAYRQALKEAATWI